MDVQEHTVVVDEFDGDDDDIPMSPSEAVAHVPDGQAHERMFTSATSNNLIISQMDDELRKMNEEKTEHTGHIQYLMFKVHNSDKEKAQLQSQLLDIRKSYEDKLSAERKRHDQLEGQLRSELTYQEQEQRSREFRDRLNGTVNGAALGQPSQATACCTQREAADESMSAAPLHTKRVVLNARRSDAVFPRTLNDSNNIAALFSHRKRPIGESQTTFQSVPSPTKDPYERPDFFYDIKRKRPYEDGMGTTLRRDVECASTSNIQTQTKLESSTDIRDCISDKGVTDAIWALQDGTRCVDFWNEHPVSVLKGDSPDGRLLIRNCSFG